MYRRQLLKAITTTGLVSLLKPGLAQSVGTSPLRWRNWSESQSCTPQLWKTPANEAELAELMSKAPSPIRCVGAGHSFSPLVPTEGTLLSIDRLGGIQTADITERLVTFGAGTRIAQASAALDQKELAFINQPDIDSQTLAGAIATGTHGTGLHLGAMHAYIESLTLISPQGRILECDRHRNPDLFAAARVSLGSLGAISKISMRVRERHALKRQAYLMQTEDLLRAIPDLATRNRHFECFVLPHTGYGAAILHNEVQEVPTAHPPSPDDDVLADLRKLRDWFGRWPDIRRWVAQKMIDPTTHEESVDWSWKLLANSRPQRFNETEGHVAQDDGVACLREVLSVLEKRSDIYYPIEFRFVAADDAWLSPFYQRASCSIAVHAAFGEPWDYLLRDIGPVLRRFGARPHWGKHHDRTTAELSKLYPRWNDFQKLRRTLDPQGRMLTSPMKQLFGETA